MPGQIVMLGKGLGLSIVVEGVERNEQLEILKKYGCDKIQGYIYCKPKPSGEMEKFLEEEDALSGSQQCPSHQ